MINAYMFDLDGTLANCLHRQELATAARIASAPEQRSKKWNEYFEQCHLDTPYQDVVALLQTLRQSTTVIILSGRSDSVRMKTQEWLLTHVGGGLPLHMRPAKDHSPDDFMKERMYNKYVKPFYNVLGVFDDRDRVVAMWRRLGLRCYQVQPGNF